MFGNGVVINHTSELFQYVDLRNEKLKCLVVTQAHTYTK